jgi:outer membrane protein assembly factor BamB/tRNA A-37 threonylcarbamoyl transferase component Bud32
VLIKKLGGGGDGQSRPLGGDPNASRPLGNDPNASRPLGDDPNASRPLGDPNGSRILGGDPNASRPLGENQSRPLPPAPGRPEEGPLTGTAKLDPLRAALGSGAQLLERNVVLQGRYEIEQVLGVGGMSTVYRARDLRFVNVIRYCAIKEMPDTSPDVKTGQLRMANFEREASLLATLSHPGIVRIYDYFAENGRAYLVLEYIEGKDLEELLDQTAGPMRESDVLNWAIQICQVLSYLHRHKPQPIVFRDMKPSNIMVTGEKVTLVDFGIAKVFQSDKKGTMIGTEGYSPPEQYRGLAEPRGDIYALGATMHHLLTNSDPRNETPFTFHERPPRQLNNRVSPWMESIIMRALEYEIDRRWATADEMLAALEEGQRQMQADGTAPAPVAAPPPVVLPAPYAAPPGYPPGYAAPPPGYPAPPYIYPPAPYGYPPPGAPGAPGAASAMIPETTVDALWTFKAEDEIRSSALVAKGIVFLGSYDSNIYALNSKTGDFLWKNPSDAGVASSPALWEDILVYGSEDHNIYALDARRGAVLWLFHTAGPVRSSPRVYSGQVYIGSDDQHLYCLDARTGRVYWKYRTWGPIRSTPLIARNLVFIGSDDHNMYALDSATSALKWKFHANGAIISSPTLGEGVIYVGSKDQNLYAVDMESGWAVWKYRTDHYVSSTPAFGGGRVFVGSADGHLYALDPQSGRLAWKFKTEGQVSSSPRFSNGQVYVGSTDSHVYCLNAANGTLRWRYRTGGPVVASPTVEDGIVYIGSLDHKLYALPV